MLRYKIDMAQATELYGKYVGNWGGEATRWRFVAKKNGQAVAESTRCPGKRLHLELTAGSNKLTERQSYDMAAVRIRIADEFGNTASYAQLPVSLSVSGNAELVGPAVVTAEGGMCGTYVRSMGRAGEATLTVSCPQCGSAAVEFDIEV